MDHALLNVLISKFFLLAFPLGAKIKVLINYTGHWSMINVKFTCSFCWYKISSWLIFLCKNHLFYLFHVPFCAHRLRSFRTFFSSNVNSLINLFQNFLHTIYISFILWMTVNNSCKTILFIRRYLITFFSYENTIPPVTNNLI